MLKSQLYTISNIVTTVATYFLLKTFAGFVDSTFLFPDINLRLNVNESLLNSYYFFWTSLTYLPSFFFLIWALVGWASYGVYYIRLNLLLTLCFILYNFEFCDFWTAGLSSDLLDTSITSFNSLLTNNLNKYHPFIFYLSVFTTLNLGLLLLILSANNQLFTLSYSLLYVRRGLFKVLLINLFALYLGSWWALQEGTWGGWWNWDASEVFGLLFTLTALRVLHSTFKITQSFYITYFLQSSIYYLVLIYFFIQLNFDLVSHNFGAKFFFFFSNNLFFLEIITLLLGALTYQVVELRKLNCEKRSLVRLNQSVSLTDKYVTHYLTPFLYTVIYLVTIGSLTPLLNYFLWNFLQVNLFNYEFSYSYYVLTLLVALVLVNPTSLKGQIWAVLLTVSYWPSILYFPLALTNFRFSLVDLIHKFLCVILIINLLSLHVAYIYFYHYALDSSVLLGQELYYSSSMVVTCDSFSLDASWSYHSLTSVTRFSNYNLFYNSNTPVINFFTLFSSNELTLNLYHLLLSWQVLFLYIETGFLGTLNFVVLTTLTALLYLTIGKITSAPRTY